MIRLIIISIVALFHLSGTAGECPSMDEVPVMYNKETFMCACNYAIIFIHIVHIWPIFVPNLLLKGYQIPALTKWKCISHSYLTSFFEFVEKPVKCSKKLLLKIVLSSWKESFSFHIVRNSNSIIALHNTKLWKNIYYFTLVWFCMAIRLCK